PKKRRRLEQALKTEGIFLEEMGLIASKERDRDRYCAILSTKGPGEIRANKAAKVMSALFHEPYQVSAGSPEYIGSTRKLFIFVKKTGRMALTGYARAVKEGEKVSGDNYSFWESEDGRLTAILSDGTGSGEKACEKSGEVLELMEKMLEVGMKVEAAVDLLNSSCFPGMEGWDHPTLDICDVNLYTGEAYFYKVGGAASFLRTKEGVEVIRGGMLPVGFLSDLHLCHLKKTLRNGDYLVMVSDGVVDAFGEAAYEEGVRKALEEIKEDHPKALAEELIRQAICAQGGHIPDDMTVLVLGIFEKNNP
ncbi:MAG: SpoIIE family protein phosphatase, partial [Lachnospiraceae bacterium]|nr:SpoIIE family protein phosphatase [Lachnospiraceae bacterium]